MHLSRIQNAFRAFAQTEHAPRDLVTREILSNHIFGNRRAAIPARELKTAPPSISLTGWDPAGWICSNLNKPSRSH